MRSPLERFQAKYQVDNNGCWIWTSTQNGHGYGAFYLERRSRGAHRVAYEWWVGPIPEGLHIDHLCNNRLCVNPDHLEAVTQAENNRRAGEVASSRTHCRQGHRYTPETTRMRSEGTGRRCLICMRSYQRRYYEKSREEQCAV